MSLNETNQKAELFLLQLIIVNMCKAHREFPENAFWMLTWRVPMGL